jgi:signal transduction histidine kinase
MINWFNNLKIKHKELVLILLMLLFPIIIGTLSYLHDKRINEELKYNYENQVLSIEYLYELKYISQETNVDLLKLMINGKQNSREIEQEIYAHWKQRDKLFSNYIKYTLDDYEKSQIDEIKALYKNSKHFRAATLKLISEGKRDQAYKFYTDNEDIINKYDNKLEELAFYNIKQSKENYLRNQRRVVRDNLINIAVLIISLFLSIPLGLYIGDLIVNPLKELAAKMEKVSRGDFNITRENVLPNDEVGVIKSGFYDMADKLKRLIFSERIVKDIVFETRRYEDHDQIYNFLLNKLVESFGAERALHLHYDEQQNLIIRNEVLMNTDLEPIINTPLLLAKYTHELFPKVRGDVLAVENVNNEIHSPKLKEYLLEKNIGSFMIYPLTKVAAVEEPLSILSLSMLCSPDYRQWTAQEIETFKLMVNTSNLVYVEAKQRKELEDTRSTFLATLTHDLRSPIIAEQKALEAILSKKLGESLDDFSEYLDDIYKTNDELLRIVNNILSSYHYESGNVHLKLEYVNIKDLIDESVRAMHHFAKDQGCEITTSLQENLPDAEIDREEIKRVILNLMSNAIKHNKKGTAIHIAGVSYNSQIEISVHDNGKGIPDDEKPNIFQKYPTIKRKIGTGLGLYLSKQIIDAHGGRIWFESQVGEGTTFYFTVHKADI